MTKEQAEADFYARDGGAILGESVTPQGRPRMPGHVPVRFPQTTVDRIKTLAADDHVSVSVWIRRVVDEAIRKRTEPRTIPSYVAEVELDTPDLDTTVPGGIEAGLL